MSDADVLRVVREHWDPQVRTVEHLSLGFGGWHWRADRSDGAHLFVTLDQPLWHSASSAEATYAAAAELSGQLEFVHPCVPTGSGAYTIALGDAWLSCTPWVDGTAPKEWDHEAAGLVHRLHAVLPPRSLVSWEPAVRPDLATELQTWTGAPWTGGPHGEDARTGVGAALDDLAEGVRLFTSLAADLDPGTYVPTHGEPGPHNQWRTEDGLLLLLDWETLRLAPPERDLRGGLAPWIEHDPDVLRVFELEWQLTEIHSFADWLRGPHADDEDTRIAAEALEHEIAGLRAQLAAAR